MEWIRNEQKKSTFEAEYWAKGRFLKRKDKYPYTLLTKADLNELGIKSVNLA